MIKKRRMLSLLLTFVMLFLLLPVDARAETISGPDYEYDPETQVLTITGHNPDFRGFTQKSDVKSVMVSSSADSDSTSSTLWLIGKFIDFTSLISFTVESNHPIYCAQDGVLFTANMDKLICYPAKKPGSQYLLPDSVNTISDMAFYGDSGAGLEIFARSATKEALKDYVYIYQSSTTLSSEEIYLYTKDVTGVSLDRESLTLQLNVAGSESAQLSATVAPATASMKDVLWTSSNESVATVDQSGNVTGVGIGTATITAKTLGVDDSNTHITALCSVTVENVVTDSDLTIPDDTPGADGQAIPVDAAPDTDEALTALQVDIGSTATNRTVTWTSSDPSVALLQLPSASSGSLGRADINGHTASARLLLADAAPAREVSVTLGRDTNTSAIEIVPQGTGTVTITAKAGNAQKTFTLKLTNWVDSVTLDTAPLYLAPEGTATLAPTIEPVDIDSGKTVTWTIGSESVADVTGNADGTATVTAKNVPGDTTAKVAVTTGKRTVEATRDIRVRSVSLGEAPALQPGGSGQITATVLPTGTADKALTWTSSNTDVATVTGNADGTATITAVAVGDTTIKAALSAEGATAISAECTFTVTEIPVTSVTLDHNTLKLTLVGGDSGSVTGQLTAAVLPADATDQTVTWTSSDQSVATVDDTGKVTAYNAGTTTITATSGNRSDTCTVTVTDGVLTLDHPSITLWLGKESSAGNETLTATLDPIDAITPSVAWTSNDTSIVTVSDTSTAINPSTGKASVTLYAQKAGDTTITAKVGNREATCAVHVKQAAAGVTITTNPLPTLKLSSDAEKTGELSATITPDDVTEEIKWESSDESVIMVSAPTDTDITGGKSSKVTLTAVGGGTATITVSCGSRSDTCTITVPPLVGGVTISHSSLELEKGTSGTLTASVTPAEAENKNISWSSDSPAVSVGASTLDAGTGVSTVTITANSVGTATITATSEDGGKTAECIVKVTSALDTMELPNKLTITRGADASASNTGTLTVSVTPKDTTAGPVYWASGDISVVTVADASTEIDSGSGSATVTLSALKAGSAIITATIGTESRSCTVTVLQKTGSVSLPDTLALALNHSTKPSSAQLTAQLTPSDATDAVSWSSSDTSVANVDQEGNVSAVGKGTATITATSNGQNDTCAVTVTVYATGVTLDKTDLTLEKGEDVTLTATVLPSGASDDAVTWTTGNRSVATVENGVVHAVGIGTTTVTATAHDGSGRSASCTVTVNAISVKKVTFDPSPKTVKVGETADLSEIVTVSPAEAANKALTWKSLDESVATVDASGKVTGVAMGTATITATAKDGSGVSGSCTVEVPEVSVSGLTMSQGTLGLLIDPQSESARSEQLYVTIDPGNASYRDITWKVLEGGEGVVSVTRDTNDPAKATVTALDAGKATVTATTSHGADGSSITVSCVVTVTKAATNVWLDSEALVLKLQRDSTVTGELKATIQPANVTDEIRWESSDESVIMVSAPTDTDITGGKSSKVTLTAVGSGTATITVSCGRYSDSYTMTILPLVDGVRLDETALTLAKGADVTLTATVTPTKAENKAVTWTTDDENIATVENGVVHAAGVGTATITATTDDGGYQARCTVTVTQAATDLSLDKPSLTLSLIGDDTKKTGTLVATVKPADVTDEIEWSISGGAAELGDAQEAVDAGADTKTSTAQVTALTGGTATVTVTVGTFTKTCTITVPVPVTGIKLDSTALTIQKNRTATLTATVSPENAADKTVTWASSNGEVAEVTDNADGTATVTAKAADGTATITATAAGGKNITAVCTVTAVPVAVTGVSLPARVEVERGSTYTLTPIITPGDAANQKVYWSSSDTDVATVSDAGVVTAKAVGDATVTVRTEDGSFTATCIVHIPDIKVCGLSLSDSTLTLYLNGSGTTYKASGELTATITPANTTDTITWLIDNTAVIEKAADEAYSTDATAKIGTLAIAAKGAGTTTVTVIASSGKTAQCVVTVKRLATGVTLGKDALALEVGGTERLTATVEPASATDPSLMWSTSKATVATVNGGLVTATGVGTATITATTADGSGKSATLNVTVSAVSVKGVSISPKNLILRAGESETLTATITPVNAADQDVIWTSSNSNAATVTDNDDGTATVTAVKANDDGSAATATITATTADGGKTDVCYVTVQPTAVTKITLSPSSLNIVFRNASEREKTITATVEPESATNKNLTWSSSNTGVVTVDHAGKITAIKAGSAVITARSVSNGSIAATCDVTVKATPVAGVSLDADLLELDLTDSRKLTPTLTSATEETAPDNTGVTWNSSDESVATVDSDGTVRAVAAGTAVITVRTDDQGKTATCVVRVWRKVTSVELNKPTLTLDVGGSETLTATVLPSNAANRNITWSSGDTTVATVDASGRVTGVSAGTAIITVTTEDQGETARCTVTVRDVAVSTVSLSQTSMTLLKGEERTLTVSVSPDNATDKTVAATSSSNAVVVTKTSDTSFTVKAEEAVSSATITVGSGSVTTTCTVTVYEQADSVTIKKGETSVTALTLVPSESVLLTADVGPAGADQTVTWYSSNSEVATVVNGAVTALKTGTATITAVSKTNTSVTASCNVTVIRSTTGVELSAHRLSFDLSTGARSAVLTATLDPADSTDGVTWTVTEGNFVQLSTSSTENGKSEVTVYALKSNGSTVVQVTASSGNESDVCTVTVTNPATGILLDQAELTLTTGSERTLKATLLSESGSTPDASDVTWTSSAEDVATVVNGTVTAVAKGKATITASITVGGKVYSQSCDVTVNPILVKSLTPSANSMSLDVGGTGNAPDVTVTFENDAVNTDDDAYTWSSSNTAVATVDSRGVILAREVGTTILTATAADDSGITATCLLTVNPIAVTRLTLSSSTLTLSGEDDSLTATMEKGAGAQLNASVNKDATDSQVIWRSNNENIVSVEGGSLTAKSVGKAIITVTAHGNESISKSVAVTVTAPVSGVTLNTDALSLTTGSQATLTATVAPADATNKAVTWSTSDDNIATVDNGVVTAGSTTGQATITVTTVDGDKTATCTVTVTEPVVSVTGVRITNAPTALVVGGSPITLTATVTPANATNQAVTWSSTSPSVASVDAATGIVTPRAAGTTAIIVTTADGSKTASCNIDIVQKATGVTVSPTSLSLAVGRSADLTAAVSGDATDPSIVWSVDDDSIVSVAQNGRVTALKAGEATVTVTTQDGSNKSASCIITVYTPVTTVRVQQDDTDISSLTLNLVTKKTAQLSALADGGSPVISWSSSDSTVVVVDNNGALTAAGDGVAIVTATATTGSDSETKDIYVRVEKATLNMVSDTTLTLTPQNRSGVVEFSPWADGAAITWSGAVGSVIRTEGAATDGKKPYTLSTLQNGVFTLSWAQADGRRYGPSGGDITIYSVLNPITAVSVTSDAALTASVDQANRTINVSGSYTGSTAPTYTLNYTLANDVLSGLSCETGTNAVIVKNGTETVCTYDIVESISQLPENVEVKTTVSLVASDGAPIAGMADVSAVYTGGLEAAAISTVIESGDVADASEITFALTVSQNTGTAGGVQYISLDIAPSYTVTTDGVTSEATMLHTLDSAVEITVTVSFNPTLVKHYLYPDNTDVAEYITPTSVNQNDDGTWTVSWMQKQFSTVELLSDEAVQAEVAQQSTTLPDEPDPPAPDTPEEPDSPSQPSTPPYSGDSGSLPSPAKPSVPAESETPMPEARTFADVAANHWAAEAIGYVSARGIFNGVGNDKFAPELTTSRAMIAQILFNFDDGDKSAANVSAFGDASGKWYEQAASWAATLGVTGGSYGKFNGDDAVTREQLAAMLYRYAMAKGYDLTVNDAALSSFPDAGAVSGWAGAEMRWAVSKGLIGGISGSLEPAAGATRAQVAMIMMRFCETVVK